MDVYVDEHASLLNLIQLYITRNLDDTQDYFI